MHLGYKFNFYIKVKSRNLLTKLPPSHTTFLSSFRTFKTSSSSSVVWQKQVTHRVYLGLILKLFY